MKRILCGVFLWSSAFCSLNVCAQTGEWFDKLPNNIYGTTETRHDRLTYQGALQGCTIVYNALIRDWTYSVGAPLLVAGHFGLFANEKGVIWTLKVVTSDVHDGNPPEFVPNKPFMAYLEDNQGVSNLSDFVESHDSDIPGGKLYIFRFFGSNTGTNGIFEAIVSNRISVVFNRKEKGVDIRVPIDLFVIGTNQNGVRVRGKKTLEDFGACTMQLLDAAQETLNK